MAHILARLSGVKLQDIRKQLVKDAPAHAQQGMYLEHVWQNVNNADEVLFLFRTDDISYAKRLIEDAHSQARKQDPNVNLPHMTFLEEDSLSLP